MSNAIVVNNLYRYFGPLKAVDGINFEVPHGSVCGFVGANGRGTHEFRHCMDRVDITTGTLGKALGGFGAFVACDDAMADYLVQFARPYIYTTALPPAVAAAAAASVRHLKTSEVERTLQNQRVAELRERLDDLNIPHLPNASHIIPVIVGDPVKCKFVSDTLLDEFGIYIQPINYPTVPKGTERLRITPSPVHSSEDIEHLAAALGTLWQRCQIARIPVAAQ